MSSNTSAALITDFDGTLVRLAVDWPALRAKLGVERVHDAVQQRDEAKLRVIREAEIAGALDGEIVAGAVRYAEGFAALVVLTNNAEASVHAFLRRRRALAERCVAVLGRETHGQRKQDLAVFAEMVARGAALLKSAPTSVTYLGDEDYELRAARELGLRAVAVSDL